MIIPHIPSPNLHFPSPYALHHLEFDISPHSKLVIIIPQVGPLNPQYLSSIITTTLSTWPIPYCHTTTGPLPTSLGHHPILPHQHWAPSHITRPPSHIATPPQGPFPHHQATIPYCHTTTGPLPTSPGPHPILPHHNWAPSHITRPPSHIATPQLGPFPHHQAPIPYCHTTTGPLPTSLGHIATPPLGPFPHH
ncbi:hypothetical protein Pcinc_028789 [Petrolisthes cinctipes]|uniref:Uncharacterized protein n=1 Tax=Petrolisthes cinctipes TaxID=88211 RepID=A0AAE1F2G5_PETCI|nr:hypothetical protein Pcinc_028789 [Petrolisthes cinctipes]